ncbi:MAG: hypothetical protein V4502_00555 [Pseudomonadota bacterium]
MSHKEELSTPASARAWTRAEDYLGMMARKRSARAARREQARTQPEHPRLLLSTLPFLVLIALLAVLGVAIMIAAYPGNQPPPRKVQAPAHEQGVAPKGWFQEAQKEFH